MFFRRLKLGSKIVFSALSLTLLFMTDTAEARELVYNGSEQPIYIRPGEPTQIEFPSNISGGYRRRLTALALQRRDNFLIVFAKPELSIEGEGIIVHLDDKRTFALRLLPSGEANRRDALVKVVDTRDHFYEEEGETIFASKEFAPPSIISGLMREMVLVAEFGKKKGIPGYKRTNRYSGEVLLHDGAMEAKLDEIFIGGNLWGYVLTVENLLNTSQMINPASFRLDGTRAVLAQSWELAPRPNTAEQAYGKAHLSKVYIVTKSRSR